MFGAFGAGEWSVDFLMHCGLIVFEYKVLFNRVALGFNEVLCVQNWGECLVSADKFWFGGAFGVDFLLVRETDHGFFSKGHHCSCVTLAVFVYSVKCPNTPADGWEVVCGEVQFHVAHTAKVLEDLFDFSPIVFVGPFYVGGEEGDGHLDVVSCVFAEE